MTVSPPSRIADLAARLPPVRGKLQPAAALAPFTWFRVGGPADMLFLPEDADDLASFLAGTPADIPVTVLGVGSNTIVRDGGVEGVVVRLMGRRWAGIVREGEDMLSVGAGALDLAVARAAADAGLSGLEFLSGIPGTIGGALRMNAGCYGGETKDILVSARALDRSGRLHVLPAEAFGFSYRHSQAPADMIFLSATFRAAGTDAPEAIHARIAALQARREGSQPIREKTGGSTFANPDPPGTPDQRSAWKLIDAAGMRGARRGGAQVSTLHCNFLINADNASAADIEGLGEDVRAAVAAQSGVDLRWEIKRIGRPS